MCGASDVPQVILTGFMATGKSEVGRRLARRLGRPFVDLDKMVEAAAGKTVASIFAAEGEARFRQLERGAVEEACRVPDAVIATGGGTLLDPENRRRLASAGPIVCLSASPEEILRRIGDAASRPLLAEANGGPTTKTDRLARIRGLLAERAPVYALATHAVDTAGLDVDAVVRRVCALVEGRPVSEPGTTAERTEHVRVELGPRSYSIVVGTGLLDELGPRLAESGLAGRCALVTSERIGALYRDRVVDSLAGAGFRATVVEIPDGEEHKNLAWLAVVCERLLEAGIERRTPVVALGGGVVTDLAGFAAATLLRGLPWVPVPTTLLGQVDAAIGGKTAVNQVLGKNLIGAFHQPRLVLADIDVLRTLPRRELVAGMAEVIKYAAIRDPALFGRLEESVGDLLALRPEDLVPVVAACARHKAAVVAEDEREERGARAVLNFGHTVGHAIEALTDYREWLHGEAVAIGMVAAARLSRGLGRCPASAVDRLERLLMRAGLPTEIPSGLAPAALALAMQTDKKSAGGRIRFVCLEDIGRTAFVELSAQEIGSHL
jgi:shikimate kinase / 3-dehydroquinate synthase